MKTTNKHIILNHLAESKGLRRKDLVTFICKLNGYDGHKQGYYGTNLQGWAYQGYIVKKGNKWYIGNLGKLYLKHPKQATQKARIRTLKNHKEYWERECRSERKIAWKLSDQVTELESELNDAQVENHKLSKGIDLIGTTFGDKVDQEYIADHERLMEVFCEVRDERDTLKEHLGDAEQEIADANLRCDDLHEQLQQGKRNTLTLQEPPKRDDYSDFTKAELIAIIKKIL